MEIIKSKNDNQFTIGLKGRLDTTTAPELETVINTEVDGISELEFDFTELEYISSAGLRVLLSAQKKMNTLGSMKVKNVSETVMDVFEITGFSDILTIV